jgi:hypothetical protein
MRQSAREKLELINIYSLPNMKKDTDRRRIINHYQAMSRELEVPQTNPDEEWKRLKQALK